MQRDRMETRLHHTWGTHQACAFLCGGRSFSPGDKHMTILRETGGVWRSSRKHPQTPVFTSRSSIGVWEALTSREPGDNRRNQMGYIPIYANRHLNETSVDHGRAWCGLINQGTFPKRETQSPRWWGGGQDSWKTSKLPRLQLLYRAAN